MNDILRNKGLKLSSIAIETKKIPSHPSRMQALQKIFELAPLLHMKRGSKIEEEPSPSKCIDKEKISLDKEDFLPEIIKTYRSLKPHELVLGEIYDKMSPRYRSQQERILAMPSFKQAKTVTVQMREIDLKRHRSH